MQNPTSSSIDIHIQIQFDSPEPRELDTLENALRKQAIQQAVSDTEELTRRLRQLGVVTGTELAEAQTQEIFKGTDDE